MLNWALKLSAGDSGYSDCRWNGIQNNVLKDWKHWWHYQQITNAENSVNNGKIKNKDAFLTDERRYNIQTPNKVRQNVAGDTPPQDSWLKNVMNEEVQTERTVGEPNATGSAVTEWNTTERAQAKSRCKNIQFIT